MEADPAGWRVLLLGVVVLGLATSGLALARLPQASVDGLPRVEWPGSAQMAGNGSSRAVAYVAALGRDRCLCRQAQS